MFGVAGLIGLAQAQIHNTKLSTSALNQLVSRVRPGGQIFITDCYIDESGSPERYGAVGNEPPSVCQELQSEVDAWLPKL